MKKIIFLIAALLCLCPFCHAYELPSVYENAFDVDLADWSYNKPNPEYTQSGIISEEGNNVLDIAGAVKGFHGGFPVSLVAHTTAPCGNNYILSLRAKIVGNYEYAGIVFRKNSKGNYNAIVLDMYTNTFCLSKNTIYTDKSYVENTRKSYSLIDGFDPKKWNDYKFVIADNNLKFYVNEILVLDYTDENNNLYDMPAAGGGVLTSVALETHIYIDDIKFSTYDTLLTNFYEIRGNIEKDLKLYPNGVKVLPEEFKLVFDCNVTNAELTVYDSENNEEIPVTAPVADGNAVTFKTCERLCEGKAYIMKLKKITVSEDEEVSGFSPISFNTVIQNVTTEGQFSEDKLSVTVKSANRREVSAAMIIAAAYNDGYVSEIKAQKAVIPPIGYIDLVPFEFKEVPDKIVIYAWSDLMGTQIYTEPLEIEVQ